MTEDVSKIRAALEILRVPRPKQRRQHSWVKKTFHSKADGHCILGAMEYVGGVDSWHSKDVDAIIKIIQEQYPDSRYYWVPDFNDAKGRTFEDVERVMEKAAILREEEGAISDWSIGG